VTHVSERDERTGHAETWTGPEHRLLRGTVRALVEREIVPFLATWERQGELPRSLSRRFGEAGLLGAGWPEAVGGSGGDLTHAAAATGWSATIATAASSASAGARARS
jgi:alkylation response protein AidB-like acyl-CoA dehydrogenase